MGFSTSQVYGQFFMVGLLVATFRTPEEGASRRKAIGSLAPFDHNIPLDEQVGDYWVDQSDAIEEFVWWSGIEVTFRAIEVAGLEPRRILTPGSRGLFPHAHTKIKTMSDSHNLYMDFYETIGARIRSANVGLQEALMSGIFQMQVMQMMDMRVVAQLDMLFRELLSPVLTMVTNYAVCGKPDSIERYSDIQIALQGLWPTSDEMFMASAWPYQSMIFYENDVELMYVNNLDSESFFEHCCVKAQALIDSDFRRLPRLSDTTVELDALPRWGDRIFSFEALDAFVSQTWGLDSASLGHHIDTIHYRACLVHCVFCALAKAKETIH